MISKATAEERARKRVKKQEGHELVIHWLPEHRDAVVLYHHLALSCSCGKELRGHSYTTRTGSISSWDIKAFNQHVNTVRNAESEMGEPILVGYVHKQRVSNEVWVFNEQNDVPEKQSRHYGIQFWAPWMILLKNRDGWQTINGANTKEAATQKAAKYLDNKSLQYEVEYVYKTKVGVEAPVATIVNSVTRLVDLAAETPDNPVKLADTLKLIDEGVTQLKILIPLRNSVKERLEQSLTLDLE
jgi:hypothetical protein